MVSLSVVIGTQAVLTRPVRVALWHLTVLCAGLYVALTHLTIGQFLVINTVAGGPSMAWGAVEAALRSDPDSQRVLG